ncbi:hypothetical protein WA1_42255 [Scytonema hofmannii PCC 7110]|uniref:Uncharacterized protein n=1 Tax=Scytonema hofmannii PCC 7110 TaxID=128403 RepID=A0A139WV98_9CYAN|nr:hypothetical protein [Scytonema hofmannii]KYC36344.1 hypothetical protein WA1_42255 [Scytonema hofmannii PCC 7110]
MQLTEEKVDRVADVIPYIHQLKDKFEKSRLAQSVKINTRTKAVQDICYFQAIAKFENGSSQTPNLLVFCAL